VLSFDTVDHIFKYDTKALTVFGVGCRVNKFQGVRLDLESPWSGYISYDVKNLNTYFEFDVSAQCMNGILRRGLPAVSPTV
jgi:hypothetical protein